MRSKCGPLGRVELLAVLSTRLQKAKICCVKFYGAIFTGLPVPVASMPRAFLHVRGVPSVKFPHGSCV